KSHALDGTQRPAHRDADHRCVEGSRRRLVRASHLPEPVARWSFGCAGDPIGNSLRAAASQAGDFAKIKGAVRRKENPRREVPCRLANRGVALFFPLRMMKEKSKSDLILIDQLELSARIGVPDAERAQPQRLTATLTLQPQRDFSALQDRIEN